MHSDAERILNNLNILSVLSQNDKLLTNEDTFDIHSPTTMRALYRFWCGEKRLTNIQRVRTCVRGAMNFVTKSLEEIKTMVASSSISAAPEHVNLQSVLTVDCTMKLKLQTTLLQHTRMLNALKDAQKGITNLVQTYRDDPALSSQVRLIVDEISDFVQVIHPHSALLTHHFCEISASEEITRRTLTQ